MLATVLLCLSCLFILLVCYSVLVASNEADSIMRKENDKKDD